MVLEILRTGALLVVIIVPLLIIIYLLVELLSSDIGRVIWGFSVALLLGFGVLYLPDTLQFIGLLIILIPLWALKSVFDSSRTQGSQRSTITDIRRIGADTRTQLDRRSDAFLHQLREHTRRHQ